MCRVPSAERYEINERYLTILAWNFPNEQLFKLTFDRNFKKIVVFIVFCDEIELYQKVYQCLMPVNLQIGFCMPTHLWQNSQIILLKRFSFGFIYNGIFGDDVFRSHSFRMIR